MEYIELLKDLIKEWNNISFRNQEKFSKVLKRTKLITEKTFGEDSKYLLELSKLNFVPNTVGIAGLELDERTPFVKDKKQIIELIEIMIEDKKLELKNGEVKSLDDEILDFLKFISNTRVFS